MAGKTLDEIRRAGLAALERELGQVDTVRFLQQFEKGEGDYTEDHHQWLDGVSMDDLLRDLERLRNNQPG
jgi:hypothetical protein